MSERESQIEVFEVLALNEAKYPQLAWVYASMNGLFTKSPRMAMDRKRQGQKAGVSDICLPFQSAHKSYPGAYIEMKQKPNKPTSQQNEFLAFVELQGYATCISYSADHALDFIEVYIDGKLRGRK